MRMRLQVGCSYRTRDGRKAEVRHFYSVDGDSYPIRGYVGELAVRWRRNGRKLWYGKDSDLDLIAEWVDEPAAPQGLTLLEAVQSGKEFRAVGGHWKCGSEAGWFEWNAAEGAVCYTGSSQEMWIDQEVLTTRYELRSEPVPPGPKSVQVTAADIDAAYYQWRTSDKAMGANELIDTIKKHLGLGEKK